MLIKTKIGKSLYLLLAVALLLSPFGVAAANPAAAQGAEAAKGNSEEDANRYGGGGRSGTTYYVDSSRGNDTKSGKSKGSAWRTLDKVNATTFQPGDKVLLKAGSTWTGQLWPKGSGSNVRPIVIDKYGSGPKPVIHGAGLYQETVKLFNQQYWEINNLELTNTGEARDTRRAVWIEAQDIGTANHIYLKNLDIHDVNGQTEVQDLESGGIIVRVTGSATPTKFHDLLIEDNTFVDVDSTGIYVRSNWRNRDTRTDGVGPWLGFTEVVIRGNSLNRTGGDAIIVCESEGALIEYNVAANSYYDSVGYHAAIWAINSDNALFQYNEAYMTRTTMDGMGFDIDELCNNCVMQHNYSHDNEGGFMLLVGRRGGDGTGYDKNGIVRYNISENDDHAIVQAVGRMDNYQVYNNTFYTSEDMKVQFLKAPDGNNMPQGTMSFKNNIIYNLGTDMTYYCGNATCTFDSNTFYGNHDSSEPDDPNKLTSDPLLIGAGSGGTGRSTVDGYRLGEGSPSLGSGTVIADNGGKDYWGNAVSSTQSPNRGAYNGKGVNNERIGSGINSYLFKKEGKEVRMLSSSMPQEVAIRVNGKLIVKDADGEAKSYSPDNAGYVYLTLSEMALELTGKVKEIKPSSKYALQASSAYRGDAIRLKLTVDNTGKPRSAINARLLIEGQEIPVKVASGKTAVIDVTVPASELAGSLRLVGEIVSHGKAIARIAANVEVLEPLQMEVKHELNENGEALRVRIRNVSDTSRVLNGLLWTIGGQNGVEAQQASVPAGGDYVALLPLDAYRPSSSYPVKITLEAAGGVSLTFEGEVTLATLLANKSIAIDGDRDDLADLPVIQLAEEGAVQIPGYGGAADLSGSVWVTWDEDYLNIAAAIRDNVHSQEQTEGQIWLGDSIQFALSPGMPGDQTSMYEFGMALTPAGPQLYRWSAIEGETGLMADPALAVARDETRQETYYELALPWTELSPILPDDGLFGLSLLVNDNDGHGRKGWIEWGGGIGGIKDPGQFKPMRLIGQVDRVLESLSINEPLAYSALPVTLTATGTFDDGFVSRVTHADWSSSNPDIAVVANGTVTFTGEKGAVTITASYRGKEASVSAVIEDLGQYYAFDEGEGTTTKDSASGISYAIEGEPVWVDGKVGKALLFYGNSVKISPIAKDDFTFMAWIKPETDLHNHTILGQGITGSQANMFNWWITNGQLYFLVSDAEGAGHGMWPFNTEPGSIPLGEWTHVAVAREGNTFQMYLNGENVLTKTVSHHQNQLTNPNPFRIGAQNNGEGGPSEGFHGAIDELRLYPEALSADRIRELSGIETEGEPAIKEVETLMAVSNVAYGKTALVSSSRDGNVGSRAFDESAGTKWESEASDPQWLIADLGKPHRINRTKLTWGSGGAGQAFKIQVSNDMIQWTDVYSTTTGNGSVVDVSFQDMDVRFVRVYGTKRNGTGGYGVQEFEVYGEEIPYQPPAVPPVLPHLPIPTEPQIAYQKMETIAFAHFGMNTFTDREWGTGTESPSLFNPTDFDARQWVSALKDAGFKLLILTAKHHDGFALWPSAYTTHDVASSPWKNGQGDVVKEVSDACLEFGIKFGLYVSPWDMHEPTYGSGLAYNDFFVNQLTELMTNYGEISEIWFDGAKGDNTPQDYDTERWYSVIKQLQPNIVIWGAPGDARYIGNEDGIASETNWAKVVPQQPGNPYWTPNQYGEGNPNGTAWQSGEADVPLRPGWFYHDWEDTHIKTLPELVDIYQKSVGRGANLLLNVSPDKRGKLVDSDINRLMELRNWIDQAYGVNLAAGSTASASNVRGNASAYAAGKLTDGQYDSYWATDDQVTSSHVDLNLGATKTFNAVTLQEYIPLGQRISGFNVQVRIGGSWTTVATGTTIGYKRIVTFDEVESDQVRINILSSQASPLLNFAGVYDIGELGAGGGSQDADREQYFDFDEGQGSTATESVSGQALSIEGGYSWVPGKVGQALRFNGSDTSIVTDSIVKDNFTFAAWIKPESDGANRIILGQGITGSQTNMFNWWIANGKLEFLMADALGQGHSLWPFATASSSIPLNEWTHVAVSKAGSQFKLYIDGQLALTKSASSDIVQTNNPNPFRIGGQNAASQGAAEVFHGAIDELRMYPRTLTDQEVFALSQAGGQPPQVINVALIGDSITTGSYPAQLQTLLGPNYYINPYGSGGTTMLKNGDHPYWDSWEFVNSSNWEPDIVVIMLGTNDSTAINWQHSSEFVSDYEDMIDHYRGLASQPTVYVATSPHNYWPGNVVTSEVVPLQIQAAANKGSTVIHVNPGTQNMGHNFPDNVHPNDAGSTTIATAIYNALKGAGKPSLSSAFSKIEAEHYSSKSGSVQAEPSSEGSDNLGFIGTGDYTVYEDVNFGLGAASVDARIAGSTVGKIEIRLGSPTGTLIGTVNGVNTGSYQTYTTAQAALSSVSGVHDVYLVYTAGLNLNWFQFKQ
jgi:alpha-L-fucosidase/lysophospholipase L1-like esterase